MTNRQRYEWLKVKVERIVKNNPIALCVDDNGQEVQVSTSIRTGGGAWPQIGQTWLLHRIEGRWTFHAIVAEIAPIVIKAPRDTMDAGTEEIFDALISLGLVSEDGGDFTRRED